jgi:hypothetical protein
MVGVVTAGEVTTMDGGEVEATIMDGAAIAIGGDSARLSRTNDRRVREAATAALPEETTACYMGFRQNGPKLDLYLARNRASSDAG